MTHGSTSEIAKFNALGLIYGKYIAFDGGFGIWNGVLDFGFGFGLEGEIYIKFRIVG